MKADRYEIPDHESFELLHGAGIGRLCIVDHGYPLAVPVNFRMVGTTRDAAAIVRTGPMSMLSRYEGLASLEVDDVSLDTGTAWSIIARGTLRRVTGSHSLPDPQPLLGDSRSLWMRLDVSAMSGRRFEVSVGEDGYSVEWQLTGRR